MPICHREKILRPLNCVAGTIVFGAANRYAIDIGYLTGSTSYSRAGQPQKQSQLTNQQVGICLGLIVSCALLAVGMLAARLWSID